MNGINNPIIFYPAAFAIILFAFLTIKLQNIFHSLLSAIVVFFITGMLFYVLGSEYNAIIQIAIYGVAVPIILGLAIMFTNLKQNKTLLKKQSSSINPLLYILGTIFAIVFLILLSPYDFNIIYPSEGNPYGIFKAFGEGIFIKYVFAFELISLILTIVIVGMSMFSKTNFKKGDDV